MDRAWAMYQETLEKRIPIDTDTYNSLIRVANFLKESADLRWNLISELLTNMKNQVNFSSMIYLFVFCSYV